MGLKYDKINTLCRYGLIDRAKFESKYICYGISELPRMLDDVEKDFSTKGISFHLLKLLNKDTISAKNFFVDEANFEQQRAEIMNCAKIGGNAYDQAWHIRGPEKDMVGGRILYGLDGELFPRVAPSTIEIVNCADLREIDKYPNFSRAYCRMSKENLGYPYQIEQIIAKTSADESHMLKNLEPLNNAIAPRQKRLVEFAGLCKKNSAKCVTFDFIFFDNQFEIVDFDTGIDKELIENLR